MKAPWKTLGILILLNCIIPGVVKAQLKYTVNTDLTITITGYTGPGGSVAIPETINGLPVTSIGDNAFANQYVVTNITILNNVTNIGRGAFSGCSGLTNVSIGTNVITIGPSAFAYCNSLSSITIPPKVVRIEDYTFAYCGGLITLAIPQGITNIGPQGFENLISLQAIDVDGANLYYSSAEGVLFDKSRSTLLRYPAAKAGSYLIPNSVSCIAAAAFRNCTKLTSLTTGTSVTNIGDCAFQDCSGLANATFPNALSSIGTNAFYNCLALSSFAIGENVNTIKAWTFFNCAGLTNVTIGSSVTNIGDWAFAGCGLTSLTIPDSVNSIGRGSFSLRYLTQLSIGNHVVSIGSYAFRYCTSLTSLAIPDSVTNIGYAAFELCTSLTNVTVGRGVSRLEPVSFNLCSALTAIYFLGNAPVVPAGFGTLPGTSIVYYVPGTLGWSSPFAGRPALPISMEIQTGDVSFGLRTGQFGFNIAGSYGLTIVVEAATNLARPAWYPLATNTLTTTSFYFSDPQWANYPNRFYRLRWP